MKKLSIFFFIFLVSCASTKTERKVDFKKDMTFDEFKSNLGVYVNNSEYPNIDE